jgi:hypothetical protein
VNQAVNSLQVFAPSPFLIRINGTCCFWKLRSYDELSPAQQILWTLLGRPALATDKQQIALTEDDELSLLDILKSTRLAGFVAYNLRNDPTIRESFHPSDQFEQQLRRLVLHETRDYELSIERFKELYADLQEAAGKVYWLKGTGLAHLVYPSSELRLSGDFDILATPSAASEVEQALLAAGYVSDLNARTQTGCAPADNIQQVCLQPSSEFVCCDALVFCKKSGQYVELKLDPLDRGLAMVNIEELFKQSVLVQHSGYGINCPGLEDQLLIACVHLRKDNFAEIRRLVDIHLIVRKMQEQYANWNQFADRARKEGLGDEVWIALALASDRLGTKVPQELIRRLQPRGLVPRWLAFTLSPRFLWNQNSLPMLLASAIFGPDGKRKFHAIRETFLPESSFLAQYYLRKPKANPFALGVCLLMHWFVLIMPSGVIKRTLGVILWKPERLKKL